MGRTVGSRERGERERDTCFSKALREEREREREREREQTSI